MNFGPQFLKLFLVNNAEVLLLVDDDKTEIAELHLLSEQRMGSDDDIDIATRKPLFRFRHIFRSNEARHLTDLDGQALKARGEGSVVLAGEKRGRHDDRHLIASHGGDESRTKGNFRLAETHIAANEPVHRTSARKVFEHRFDCLKLIVRFRKRKTRAEFIVGAGLRLDLRGTLEFARSRDADEFTRHLADALFEARFACLPARTAEPVELCIALVGAIQRQELDVLDRQVELVPAVIDEQQTIMRRAHDIDSLQALEAANAVIDMNDEIAGAQACRFGEEVFVAFLSPLSDESVAKDILFADDGKLVCFK